MKRKIISSNRPCGDELKLVRPFGIVAALYLDKLLDRLMEKRSVLTLG